MNNSNDSKFTPVHYSPREDKLLGAYPVYPGQKKQNSFLVFLKNFSKGIFIAFFLFVLIIIIGLASFWSSLSALNSGKNNLFYAVEAGQNSDFPQMVALAGEAKNDFGLARLRLEKKRDNFLFNKVSWLGEQTDSVVALAGTAEILSKALEEGGSLAVAVQKVTPFNQNQSFAQFSPEAKREALKIIYEACPDIIGLKADLDLAEMNSKRIAPVGLFYFFSDKIIELQSRISQLNNLANQAVPLVELFPAFAGYPQKFTYLFLLQNSDELRPTGGFLGTYGILQTENAEITRFDTHDIYHMDMPVKDKINITPPAPLSLYLNKKWFMRDANWSPDWPSASEQIKTFYQKENAFLTGKDQINNFNGEFDGVIGITPRLIEDLLKIAGSIKLEGEVYDQNNFTKLLEYRVEKGYVNLGVSSWQRKEVIGDIAKELKTKLFDLPLTKWPSVINALSNNLARKDVLVYFSNKQLEGTAQKLGWAGETKSAPVDYLMVVDANLGGYKSDAVMNKNIIYSLSADSKGLIGKVTINYAHHGSYDWRTTDYRTYTRVFVPAGSQLIEAEGVSGNQAIKDFKVDREDFSALSGERKTAFGSLIVIKPGEIGSLTFSYRLPDVVYKKVVQAGLYQLTLQKQPGSNIENLKVDVTLPNAIESYKPSGFSSQLINQNKISWTTDFVLDKEFEVGF